MKTGPKPMPRLERLMKHVSPEPNSGCWLWTGAVNGAGYGDTSDGRARRHIGAHRAAYEIFCSEIPAGQDVCHRCDVKLCVNPAHLFLGTRRDNMQDCAAKGRNARGAFMANAVRPHVRRGAAHYRARLTDDAVREIRAVGASVSAANLARRYGVSAGAIRKVLNKRAWAHVS